MTTSRGKFSETVYLQTKGNYDIGKTPLLELTHIEKSLGLKARIFAKLEYFNPAGSVKDRIAKAMIEDAEASGKLKPDSVIIADLGRGDLCSHRACKTSRKRG